MDVVLSLVFKILKRDHHSGNIVERLGHDTVVEALVDTEAGFLVNRYGAI